MGGLTSAVDWWEEWQLRVLVLCSLAIQCLLFLFSFMRRSAIPGLIRFMMWLSYLAGDAVAIYALATLFNRHKTDEHGGSGSTLLEVVWAPVLLLHLGGHDGFTAYNIEDNELWSRHLLTAVSQVTVAVYVFYKSWPPGGDKRLWQAAILLFVPGVIKCFVKPWALKSASIYSLVSSRAASVNRNEAGEMCGLEEYVSKAKEFIVIRQKQDEDRPRRSKEPDICTGDGIKSDLLASGRMERVWRSTACGIAAIISRVNDGFMENVEYVRGAWAFVRGLFKAADASPQGGGGSSFCGRLGDWLRERKIEEKRRNDLVKEMIEGRSGACKLFVDLSSPFPRRLSILQDFWVLREEKAYGSVRQGMATAFLLLYTKLKTAGQTSLGPDDSVCRSLIHILRVVLPWASIGLFHQSHSRETQMMINGGIDVKITYAMICCTAVLESYSGFSVVLTPMGEAGEEWPEIVAQYSLIGYFAHNKKHSMMMWIASLLGCSDFLDQHWCMEESCFSSATISELVLRYLKDGWRNKIEDAASYRRFNDHRGRSEGLRLRLSTNRNRNRNRPLLFDESVLLWHIATEFCFFSNLLSEHSKRCAFAKAPTWTERFPDLTSFSGQGIKPRSAPVSHYPEEKPTTEKITEMVPKCSIFQTSSTGKNNQPTSGCDQEFACCKAVLCRQMSNYMVYLLFVNPEMLLPGSRRNLFKTAYDELKDILKDWEWNPVCWSRCMPCGVELMKEEADVMEELKKRMERKTGKMPSQEESSEEGSNRYEKCIDQAWDLAKRLLEMDEMERWEEIKNVWVEMLCFSASRCRGYLHAKALGKGGEFLSYVWLLLFHMGMETFTDKLQREPSSHEAGSNDTAEPAREVSTTTSMDRMHHPSPGGNQQYDTASTSEIRQVADDVV